MLDKVIKIVEGLEGNTVATALSKLRAAAGLLNGVPGTEGLISGQTKPVEPKPTREPKPEAAKTKPAKKKAKHTVDPIT